MMAPRVNVDRLWDSLMTMGKVGALSNGGCCRLALSKADGRGRDLFAGWCREVGCEVAVDQVGNIFARRPGRDKHLPSVATGSHLDTQPHGGRFDGVYGVLAGLEVIRTLNEHDISTKKPIDVIVWTSEEGVRFTPPMAGSSAFAGKLETSALHETRTLDGTTVIEDLRAIGYLGDEPVGVWPLAAFVEVHIEQGPILERSGKIIGVVDRVQGGCAWKVRLTGEDGHAGTTPMNSRRDACVGAARMIARLNELAAETDIDTRITVGSLELGTNSISTIPGKAAFTIDYRHPDARVLSELAAVMRRDLSDIAGRHDLEITFEVLMEKSPVAFDPKLVGVVEAAAGALGMSHMRMLSGAGHDAMNLAERVPTAMIFVPCKDGISHNEKEDALPVDLAAGADVLLQTLTSVARIV